MRAAAARVTRWIQQASGVAMATLREIFDEAAYGRFLKERGLVCSRESYARFLHEIEDSKQRRPRCC